MEPRSFPQFSRLPVEIRLRIWEFAILVPRHIEINVSRESHPHILSMNTNMADLNAINGWMALDLVNRESHQEFRRLTVWRIGGQSFRYRSSLTEQDHLVITTFAAGVTLVDFD